MLVLSIAISGVITATLVIVSTLYVVAMLSAYSVVGPAPATRVIPCADQHATYWNGQPRTCFEYAAR